MDDAFQVVKRPLVTEKNMARAENRGIYTFEVALNANKVQIRHAIEKIFKVGVVDVRTSILKGMVRRVGWHAKKSPDTKKAVVTLKKGDKIDIL
jgi:large subunit ribosomal protein L23